jgi:two-component system, cell cycle sensor histidine kinase and response regulator CckA
MLQYRHVESAMPMSAKRATILIVDDEEAVRALVAMLLSNNGYRVLVAGDYEQAMAVHQENRNDLDLLLTDISLPGRSGPEVAAAALTAQPDLKVLYMSGSTQFEVFEPNGEVPPGSGFLPKPFRSEELLGQVNDLLMESVFVHTSSNSRASTYPRK